MATVLLMVSLDSENADWLREHMANGNLPNLAALERSGVTFDVTAAPLAGVVYPTLYTGQRPADVGCYFPVQWEPAEQRLVEWTRFPLPETVFERLENAGKRIVVLDPPEAAPVQLGRGYCASGIQFRARVLLHSWSSNASLSASLLRRLGPAPRADEVFGQVSVSDLRYLRSALLQAPARLASAALEFLKHDPPDCLWVTCCGLHVAGHQFFHLPSIRDSEQRRELEGTRLELARGYDRMLGSLIEVLPAGSRVFVTYAKGMGRVTEWSDLLPAMLQRILGQEGGNQPVSLVRRILPRSIRRWAARQMDDRQALAVLARLSTPRANWVQTRAFCLPTDCPGLIRFNLAGREQLGMVRESELQGLSEEISAGLRTFTGFDGSPCVENTLTPLEVFGAGPQIHRFPDLIVKWRQQPGESDDRGGGVRSALFGEIRRSADVVGRSGNHCPGAFAILAGGNPDSSRTGCAMQTEDIPATLIDGLSLSIDGLPGRSFWK